MADRVDLDPFVECYFGLDVSGISTVAYFKALSGGEMSIALIEHNVVYPSGASSTLFIPGPTSFAPITLEQGVTSDTYFWDWWSKVTQGKNVRRNITVTAFGHKSASTSDFTIPDIYTAPKALAAAGGSITEAAETVDLAAPTSSDITSIAGAYDALGELTSEAANNTMVTTQQFESGQAIAQWELTNAWPLKISGFSFDLDSDKPYIASITIVAESIERTF